MTDAEDNDTSVIRGRAIMKARGWDSHENRQAACRLMTSRSRNALHPGRLGQIGLSERRQRLLSLRSLYITLFVLAGSIWIFICQYQT